MADESPGRWRVPLWSKEPPVFTIFAAGLGAIACLYSTAIGILVLLGVIYYLVGHSGDAYVGKHASGSQRGDHAIGATQGRGTTATTKSKGGVAGDTQPQIPPEVAKELASIVDLVITTWISTWYTSISDDKQVEDDLRAALTHVLEQLVCRVRSNLDLLSFVVNKFVLVLELHLHWYKVASRNVVTRYPEAFQLEPPSGATASGSGTAHAGTAAAGAVDAVKGAQGSGTGGASGGVNGDKGGGGGASKKVKPRSLPMTEEQYRLLLKEFDRAGRYHQHVFDMREAEQQHQPQGEPEKGAVRGERSVGLAEVMDDPKLLARLEARYLRRAAHVMTKRLLPDRDYRCRTVAHLSREIFANCILYSVVNLIAKPDNLTCWVLAALSSLNTQSPSQQQQGRQKGAARRSKRDPRSPLSPQTGAVAGKQDDAEGSTNAYLPGMAPRHITNAADSKAWRHFAGSIPKERAEQLLSGKATGTFLIRKDAGADADKEPSNFELLYAVEGAGSTGKIGTIRLCLAQGRCEVVQGSDAPAVVVKEGRASGDSVFGSLHELLEAVSAVAKEGLVFGELQRSAIVSAVKDEEESVIPEEADQQDIAEEADIEDDRSERGGVYGLLDGRDGDESEDAAFAQLVRSEERNVRLIDLEAAIEHVLERHRAGEVRVLLDDRVTGGEEAAVRLISAVEGALTYGLKRQGINGWNWLTQEGHDDRRRSNSGPSPRVWQVPTFISPGKSPAEGRSSGRGVESTASASEATTKGDVHSGGSSRAWSSSRRRSAPQGVSDIFQGITNVLEHAGNKREGKSSSKAQQRASTSQMVAEETDPDSREPADRITSPVMMGEDVLSDSGGSVSDRVTRKKRMGIRLRRTSDLLKELGIEKDRDTSNGSPASWQSPKNSPPVRLEEVLFEALERGDLAQRLARKVSSHDVQPLIASIYDEFAIIRDPVSLSRLLAHLQRLDGVAMVFGEWKELVLERGPIDTESVLAREMSMSTVDSAGGQSQGLESIDDVVKKGQKSISSTLTSTKDAFCSLVKASSLHPPGLGRPTVVTATTNPLSPSETSSRSGAEKDSSSYMSMPSWKNPIPSAIVSAMKDVLPGVGGASPGRATSPSNKLSPASKARRLRSAVLQQSSVSAAQPPFDPNASISMSGSAAAAIISPRTAAWDKGGKEVNVVTTLGMKQLRQEKSDIVYSTNADLAEVHRQRMEEVEEAVMVRMGEGPAPPVTGTSGGRIMRSLLPSKGGLRPAAKRRSSNPLQLLHVLPHVPSAKGETVTSPTAADGPDDALRLVTSPKQSSLSRLQVRLQALLEGRARLDVLKIRGVWKPAEVPRRYTAVIYDSANISSANRAKYTLYYVAVQVVRDGAKEEEDDDHGISSLRGPTGVWKIRRRYNHFLALDLQLRAHVGPRFLAKLPSLPPKTVQGSSSAVVEQRQVALNAYLAALLEEPCLASSHELQVFLTTHSMAISPNDKIPLSLSPSLDGGSVTDADAVATADRFLAASVLKSAEFEARVFALVEEIFEADNLGVVRRGAFTMVRKIASLFIGGTNKKILASYATLTSSASFAGLLGVLKETLWPGGVFFTPAPPRTPQQVTDTRDSLQKKLKELVPTTLAGLSSILGQETTEQGLLKVFDAMQCEFLMKNLSYSLLDLLLLELFQSDAEMTALVEGQPSHQQHSTTSGNDRGGSAPINGSSGRRKRSAVASGNV